MRGRQQLSVLVTAMIGAIALVLGYIGFRDAEPGIDPFAAGYQAAQLLVLEYNGPQSPPFALELGRYLGALALGMAILLVVGALARDRLNNMWIRRRSRGHIVIVGLGERGTSVAKGLREGRRRVVAIDKDAEARTRAEEEAGRISFIEADARTQAAYRNAAVRKAAHVFIAPGDDSLNLQALELCLQQIGAPVDDTGPTIHVAIEDEDLWHKLHRSAITWSGAGGAIEFLSLPDRVGLAMVEKVSRELELGDPGRVRQLIVWGAGLKAVRTAVHAVRAVLVGEGSAELVLAGPEAAALQKQLDAAEPWLAESAPTEVVAEPSGSGYDVAFVVGLSHADALAGASTLAPALSATKILVEVPRAAGEEALERSGFPIEDVELIDAEERVLGAGVLEISGRELLARAKHEDYVTQDLAAGHRPEENPALVPWGELPEVLRESNRAFADAIGDRLADLGAELVPLTGPPPEASDLLSEERAKELAIIEHERWMAERRAAGWKETTGEKDIKRKLHPSLVDFDELSEDEKRKDMDAIRVLPKLFAKMGYKIHIPDDGAPAGGDG